MKKAAPTFLEMRAEFDRLKGPGTSNGLTAWALCQGIMTANGGVWPPPKPSVVAVAQTTAAPSRPPQPKFLSRDALAALSHKAQIAYHEAWAGFYAAQIGALHGDLECARPGDYFSHASEVDQWKCYHNGLQMQWDRAVKWEMTHSQAIAETLSTGIREAGYTPVSGGAISGTGDFNDALALQAHRIALGIQFSSVGAKREGTNPPPALKQRPAATKAGEAFRQASDL